MQQELTIKVPFDANKQTLFLEEFKYFQLAFGSDTVTTQENITVSVFELLCITSLQYHHYKVQLI